MVKRNGNSLLLKNSGLDLKVHPLNQRNNLFTNNEEISMHICRYFKRSIANK